MERKREKNEILERIEGEGEKGGTRTKEVIESTKCRIRIMWMVMNTEYTDSGSGPLFGVHSMMEKLAQAVEGGVCTSTPYHHIYHHVQSCSVSGEGIYTPYISSLPLYVLC
jgi:hypothetical protein